MKTLPYIAVTLLLALLPSCQGPHEQSVVEANILLAKESFESFNKHDWTKHAEHFSDNCKYLDPSYGTEYKVVSRVDKAAKYRKMEKMSPNIHDEITCIFGYENKVAVQFTSNGKAITENGEFEWSMPICCIFTFEKGIIVMDETYYDNSK